MMKRIQYFVMMLSIAFATQGCSSDDTITQDEEKGIEIEAIEVSMDNIQTSESRAATQSGFSVNTSADPTFKDLAVRGEAGWKMDFEMYNSTLASSAKYDKGSFVGATYSLDGTKYYWTPTALAYFPNYYKPQVEAWIYIGATRNNDVAKDQSTKEKLFALDNLHRSKNTMEVAHKPYITVHHQHAMLDFVIDDITPDEISAVTVSYNGAIYTPCKVQVGTSSLEYMLILPEVSGETKVVDPVVNIKTLINTGTNIESEITYQQTIGINNKDLGENTCYCFKLQGLDLKISPVTVINWTTGESLPGEYIAVTAYPTFKATSHTNETYYFYYDSKFGATVNNVFTPYLQKITFNQNGECTIKADGRILTHIIPKDKITVTENTENEVTKYIAASEDAIKDYELGTADGLGVAISKVTLGQMVIDIDEFVNAANK